MPTKIFRLLHSVRDNVSVYSSIRPKKCMKFQYQNTTFWISAFLTLALIYIFFHKPKVNKISIVKNVLRFFFVYFNPLKTNFICVM